MSRGNITHQNYGQNNLVGGQGKNKSEQDYAIEAHKSGEGVKEVYKIGENGCAACTCVGQKPDKGT